MHGCLSDLKIKENHCECWAKWSSGYKVTFICDSCFLQSSLTCFDGHPLVLGEARGGSGTYNCNKCRVNTLRNFDKKTCVTPLNQAHYTSQSSSWRCQEDFRRGGGNCNFDLCVNCVKNLGVGNCKGKSSLKIDLSISGGALCSLVSDQTTCSDDHCEPAQRNVPRGDRQPRPPTL